MRQMLKFAVAAVFLLAGGQSAYAFWCGGPGSTGEAQHHVGEHACYELFFNNSGSAQTSGTAVVRDRTGTGVNVGVTGSLTTVPTSAGRNDIDVDGTDGEVTNIGTYITTTTSADNVEFVGIVDDDSCADQSYCRVQVSGPRSARANCAADAITSGSEVGTSTTAGALGGGAGAGVALSACRDASQNTVGLFWLSIDPGRD